jgi:hypothetical protein
VPAELVVRTNVGIAVRVEADSEDEAVQKAHRRFLDPIIALLASRTGQRAFVDVRRVGQPDDVGYMESTWSPFSAWASKHRPVLTPMEDAERTQLLQDLVRTQSDPVAVDAAADLTGGLRLGAYHGGMPPLLTAAIMRHFLVIERVSKTVSRRVSDSDESQLLRNAALDVLRRDLAQLSSLHRQVKAVRRAADALARVDLSSTKERIRATADALNISADAREKAIQIADVRNRRLGHATGSPPRVDELVRWLAAAEVSAMAYFDAYVSSLQPG